MPGAVLNDQPEAVEMPAGVEGAESLRQLANGLKAEAFDPGSGRMDYARLADSEPYRHYRRLAAGLRTFDPNVLHGQDERMAFWLNLYNALMVDAVIRFGVRTSVNEVRGLFWRAAYRIGGLRFSLNDIEHGILRANAGHPAIPGAHFAAGDPRRRFSLPALDPRIHFALNCASRSCPPIAWYRADRLPTELGLAAGNFLRSGGVRCDPVRGRVWLSRLFLWYAPDFGCKPLALGSRQPLLDFAARYIGPGPEADLLRSGRPKVRFLSYDWSLNR
jgi:hypothetical protein